MKKLLFLAVSAALSVAGYFSSVGEKVVAMTNSKDSQIEQQKDNLLVLEQNSADFDVHQWHYSHSSHESHYSHSSHRSHSSHYSSYL